ncbi:MAG: VWA domain-containing protein [Candidatus Obscuribacterales bacterium]|nr:VWA domain-containing protein [Candidatus Obscuribacterales bacterium]
MLLRKRHSRISYRASSGMTMILVALMATLILLPLGLFGFEVARLNMATKQLKAATDSAALAAAMLMANSATTDTDKTKQMALDFYKRNMVMSTMLDKATLSPTVDTDSPSAGNATLDLIIDDTTGKVTAKGSFGLEPAFGKFLGLGSQPVHTHSVAGYQGLTGDIIIALDVSDSLTLTSESALVKRKKDPVTKQYTYTFVRNAKSHPANGRLGAQPSIPPLDKFDFGQAPLDKFKDAPEQIKIAALVEAKRGNLDSEAAFKAADLDKGPLNDFFQDGGFKSGEDGFKAAYQKTAITHVLPLADEKDAIITFINEITNADAHLGLVTFGGRNSTGNDTQNTYLDTSNQPYPHVNLDKNNDKKQYIIGAISPALTHNGTDTKGAIQEATAMLESDQHRQNQPKTIILLTDGVPTTGSPSGAAKEAGKKGIRIMAVGFFQSDYAKNIGPKVLKGIVSKANSEFPGSQLYVAPTYPKLKDVLKQISHGTLALIND